MTRAGQAATLLLVEDNPADAALVRTLLGEADHDPYRIEHVTRLADAGRALDERVWDAMLVDLGLPDSTGLDTVRFLRDRTRETPLVILTGSDDSALRTRALALGVTDWLGKDELDRVSLALSVESALHRAPIHVVESQWLVALENAEMEAAQRLAARATRPAVCGRWVERWAVDAAVRAACESLHPRLPVGVDLRTELRAPDVLLPSDAPAEDLVRHLVLGAIWAAPTARLHILVATRPLARGALVTVEVDSGGNVDAARDIEEMLITGKGDAPRRMRQLERCLRRLDAAVRIEHGDAGTVWIDVDL